MPDVSIGRGEFANILDIWATAIERDRHEPDKLLCHVASLRRLATDARAEAKLSCWPAMGDFGVLSADDKTGDHLAPASERDR